MGFNVPSFGASKKKIGSLASGFSHVVPTGKSSFDMYFIDGSKISLELPSIITMDGVKVTDHAIYFKEKEVDE